jgi:hypothetical protein
MLDPCTVIDAGRVLGLLEYFIALTTYKSTLHASVILAGTRPTVTSARREPLLACPALHFIVVSEIHDVASEVVCPE